MSTGIAGGVASSGETGMENEEGGTPTSTDALRAVNPCADDRAPLRALGAPNREPPSQLSLPELPIRALPLLPHFGPCPAGARLSSAATKQDVPATGFARTIDRPPRS